MWRNVLLFIELLYGSYSLAQAYTGPSALGPFHIDRDAPIRVLFGQLGQPAVTAGEYFCYRSQDGKSYLWTVRKAHEPERAGGVLLSDFCNCYRTTVRVTPENLYAWKTEEGIGLGSTQANVLETYGKPSRKSKIDGTSFRWVIKGDLVEGTHYSSDERPERGDSVLIYTNPDDLRTAEFGFRAGKVVWIFLSNNE